MDSGRITSIPFITAGGYYDSICDIYKHIHNLACTPSKNVFMLNIASDHWLLKYKGLINPGTITSQKETAKALKLLKNLNQMYVCQNGDSMIGTDVSLKQHLFVRISSFPER